MYQVNLGILFGQADTFGTEFRLVNIVIGRQHNKVTRCEGNAVVPLPHQVLSTQVLFVAVIPDARVIERPNNLFQRLWRAVVHDNQFPILTGLGNDTAYSLSQESTLPSRKDE